MVVILLAVIVVCIIYIKQWQRKYSLHTVFVVV